MNRNITIRLRRFFSNPADGIQYNNISHNRAVSKHVWDVDIASNPRLIKDVSKVHKTSFLYVNVVSEAEKVNGQNISINGSNSLVNGRR